MFDKDSPLTSHHHEDIEGLGNKGGDVEMYEGKEN